MAAAYLSGMPQVIVLIQHGGNEAIRPQVIVTSASFMLSAGATNSAVNLFESGSLAVINDGYRR